MCDCSWLVHFKDVELDKYANTDQVVIKSIWNFHSNTCDPSSVDRFILAWTE